MSDPETLPAGVHPEVEMLPWFAAGTLREADHQRIAHHLESCHDCTRELEELTVIRRALKELSQQEAELPSRVARSVMARVRAESEEVRSEPEESWVGHIDRWFRSLLMPQWVPTLAAVLLAAQMGLLIWVTLPPVERSEVSTRSVDMQSRALKITVAFQASATEESIRTLLQRLHAQIVDGPTAEGLFTLSLPTGNPADALALLNEQHDVVRSARLVQP